MQNKKEVVFTKKHTILLKNSQDSQLYIEEYIKQLTELFKQNQLILNKIIQNNVFTIEYILYAPWFTSNIEVIEEKGNSIIDEKFIEKKLSELSIPTNLHSIENRIIKIEANGYTLTSIKKIQYPDVKLTVYSSYISKETYTNITNLTLKLFPHTSTISFSTNSICILQNIKQYMIYEDNVIFINPHDEITEVGVIQNDSLAFIATFPIGIHDFLRSIQKNIQTYDYEILNQKQILLKSSQQIEEFNTLKKNWFISLHDTLSLFNTQLPHKMLLIGPPQVKDFFMSILSQFNTQETNTVLKNCRIIDFDISVLKDIIVYKTPIKNTDLDLILEALI